MLVNERRPGGRHNRILEFQGEQIGSLRPSGSNT
jgi:hypothetical protein